MTRRTNGEHRELAEQLVAETRDAGELAPVDLDRFWADDERAHRDPFAADCPQVPLGIRMSGDCVFDELGLEEDHYRYEHDPAWRAEVNRRYNDKAERIVGRRLLPETAPDPERQYPAPKPLHAIFECRAEWHSWSYWLRESASDEDGLKALLDRVEGRLEDLRSFLLPDNWDSEKERLEGLGIAPPLYRHQRGPVTLATSVYGVENLLFLMMDNPALAERFRDLIGRAMLERGRVLDEEAGWDPGCAWGRGFSFADDNCALLTPDLYGFFGKPILGAVFDRYAPEASDVRYQHSDSAMGHLLPQLGELGLTRVNFGPTVMVEEIRAHLPEAVIEGVLAPFTFSRHDEVGMVCELLRDHEQAESTGRGLVFATAGSINNGSRLTGMRLLMAAIQRYGRYAGGA